MHSFDCMIEISGVICLLAVFRFPLYKVSVV